MRGVLRLRTSTLVVFLLGFVPACADDGEPEASCHAIREVAAALSELRASEGDTLGSAASFDAAATAFVRTPAPSALQADWTAAADALRYYSESAREFAAGRGDQTTRRSETDVQAWRKAFSRITAFSIEECGMGWRTAFDDCREGLPPGGAERTRLLFPCSN